MAKIILPLSLWHSFSLMVKENGHQGICWIFNFWMFFWWEVFFFYQGTCYIWTLSGGRGTDPVKVHLKKTFEAHSKYGIKCLFSPDSTYVFYYYSSSMHEADLFLGHYVFLEILCIAYFFTSFAHLYPTEK